VVANLFLDDAFRRRIFFDDTRRERSEMLLAHAGMVNAAKCHIRVHVGCAWRIPNHTAAGV
jgi:hypothetical protein